MLRRKYFRRELGFSLVEIIVASLLLALISAGIFSVTLSSRKIIKVVNKRHFATEVAQAVLENLRGYLGQDRWDSSSEPINPGYLGGVNNWSTWHYVRNDTFLGISGAFGQTEFATRYNGRWRYKFNTVTGGYDYRSVTAEVWWDEEIQ